MSTITHLTSLHITKPVAICWFRRDLRLHDHHALAQALKHHDQVLPLFIFDSDILDKLSNPKDARVHFIHAQLSRLQAKLEAMGSSFLVMAGQPLAIFEQLLQTYPIAAVYANEDYEPYAVQRDRTIAQRLATQGIPFHTYQDHVIFGPHEVLTKGNTPYTVFTPYMRQWRALYQADMAKPFDTALPHLHLLQTPSLGMPSLQDLGFAPTSLPFPTSTLDASCLAHYHTQRDRLDTQGTTHLGVHLRFGTVSIREATQAACKHSDTWLSQLIWRNFFIAILAHFPHVQHRAFKPAYDRIPWRHDPEGFAAWCHGHTGYPIVDAGMRELNATGFMHNRARMITASFLTKLMLIDWRLGEAYFADKLLDYELASNNGNWQWAAGTGCDAAPYFRIFNPMRQAQRFDPSAQYIQQWVPEHSTPSYPPPIVDYAYARQRALDVYQQALRP